tara:strand:- start:28056 stop:28871 length:816 start_codon:yes stop_codon:yes gene_type:complete
MIFIPSTCKQISPRMSRQDINHIALTMGVFDYKMYKNKKLLLERIQSVYDKPSDRCYNKYDPCTLENIDSIQLNELIEWNQCERHFGASICSLKNMFKENQFMLPWSIDIVSGVEKSLNDDFYKEKFDMRNVCGLVECVHKHTCIHCSEQSKDTSSSNSFMFELDSLMDGCEYSYGYIINNMINSEIHDIYFPMCEAMYNMVAHLHEVENIESDIFHQYVYINYSIQACHITDKKDHLKFIIDILKTFRDIVGKEKATSIIKVLFLELSVE